MLLVKLPILRIVSIQNCIEDIFPSAPPKRPIVMRGNKVGALLSGMTLAARQNLTPISKPECHSIPGACRFYPNDN